MNILDTILEYKKREVAAVKEKIPVEVQDLEA